MKRKEKLQRYTPQFILTINIVVTSLLYMGAGMTLVQKNGGYSL